MTSYNIDPKDPFADIDESEFEAELQREIKPTTNRHVEQIGGTEIPGFVEDCPKCHGTGNWRRGYECFKCKGKGKLTFKTSPEARAKARASSRARKERLAQEARTAFLTGLDDDVREWLTTNVEQGNSFAISLMDKGTKWGLTENQLAAVRKAIARDDDAAAGANEWIEAHPDEHAWLVRESEIGNEFADSLLNGKWGLMRRGLLSENQINAIRKNLDKDGSGKDSDIDLRDLHLGRAGQAWRSYFAVPDGDTRLKVCIRRPGKDSRYYGWTFVDDGAAYGSRKTYGKQAPDGLYKGDIQDELRAILENPLEASIAYGKLTGTCGVCGRILEDEDSVAAGIGPVCASRM